MKLYDLIRKRICIKSKEKKMEVLEKIIKMKMTREKKSEKLSLN